MTKTPVIDWPKTLKKITAEVSLLSNAERDWLGERLAVIEETQHSLNDLFLKAGGVEACTECDGACCGCGQHHVTLTNLLAYLLRGEDPPVPDFDQTCPYLSDQGCRLLVSRRPYNCITFFCETVDDRLDVIEREQLLELDKRLRSEYQRVAECYPGASLRGFWIALERIGDGPLLCSPENVVE